MNQKHVSEYDAQLRGSVYSDDRTHVEARLVGVVETEPACLTALD